MLMMAVPLVVFSSLMVALLGSRALPYDDGWDFSVRFGGGGGLCVCAGACFFLFFGGGWIVPRL